MIVYLKTNNDSFLYTIEADLIENDTVSLKTNKLNSNLTIKKYNDVMLATSKPNIIFDYLNYEISRYKEMNYDILVSKIIPKIKNKISLFTANLYNYGGGILIVFKDDAYQITNNLEIQPMENGDAVFGGVYSISLAYGFIEFYRDKLEPFDLFNELTKYYNMYFDSKKQAILASFNNDLIQLGEE